MMHSATQRVSQRSKTPSLAPAACLALTSHWALMHHPRPCTRQRAGRPEWRRWMLGSANAWRLLEWARLKCGSQYISKLVYICYGMSCLDSSGYRHERAVRCHAARACLQRPRAMTLASIKGAALPVRGWPLCDRAHCNGRPIAQCATHRPGRLRPGSRDGSFPQAQRAAPRGLALDVRAASSSTNGDESAVPDAVSSSTRRAQGGSAGLIL